MKFAKIVKDNGLVMLVGLAVICVVILMITSGSKSYSAPRRTGPSPMSMMSSPQPVFRPYADDTDMESDKAKDTAKVMVDDARSANKEAKGVAKKAKEAEASATIGADLIDVVGKAKDIEMKAGMVEKKAKDVERGARGVAYETVDDNTARMAYDLETQTKTLKQDAHSLKTEAKQLARTPEAASDPQKMDDLKVKAKELTYQSKQVKTQAKQVAKNVAPGDIDSDSSGSESDSSGWDSDADFKAAAGRQPRNMQVKGFRGFRVEEKLFSNTGDDYMLI
jgi:hypothetical protein